MKLPTLRENSLSSNSMFEKNNYRWQKGSEAQRARSDFSSIIKVLRIGFRPRKLKRG